MWVNFKCIKTLSIIYPIYLIPHFNVTIIAWLIPQLNACTFFFTLARFFGCKAIACPSPLLSTSKPFLAIFTISSHQVTPCVESSINIIIHPFICIASFKYETIPCALPHVSLINSYRACFHIVYGNPTTNKPLHEFHLHCCLVFELDCLYNNTSFWIYAINSSTCEITNFLSNT